MSEPLQTQQDESNRLNTPASGIIRNIHLLVTGIVFAIYVITFARDSVMAALFFFPFTMTPLVINAVAVCRVKTFAARGILLFSTAAYSGWGTWLYIDVFYIHIDPQSSIALLFMGIFASPVLILLWLLTFGLERWCSAHSENNST